MAQLVAHLHGMEGVGGSNPPSSTDNPHRKSVAGFSFQVTFPKSRMSSPRHLVISSSRHPARVVPCRPCTKRAHRKQAAWEPKRTKAYESQRCCLRRSIWLRVRRHTQRRRYPEMMPTACSRPTVCVCPNIRNPAGCTEERRCPVTTVVLRMPGHAQLSGCYRLSPSLVGFARLRIPRHMQPDEPPSTMAKRWRHSAVAYAAARAA